MILVRRISAVALCLALLFMCTSDMANRPDRYSAVEGTTDAPKELPDGGNTVPRALAPHEAVVTDFKSLKSALADDNNVTMVYFGADIVMGAGGILISNRKTGVVIDGMNPLEPERTQPYRLTGTDAALITETIYINGGVTSLLVRNLFITGTNYYGPFGVVDSSLIPEVEITYSNVDYNGPQLGYNRRGVLRVSNCNVHIKANGIYSPAQEVSEARDVIFEGENTVRNDTSANSLFWFPGGGSLTLRDDASLTLTALSLPSAFGMIHAGTKKGKVVITVGERAALDVSIAGIIAPEAYASLTGVTVHEGGTFLLSATKVTSKPVLEMNGSLMLEQGAVFRMTGAGGTASAITQRSGDIHIGKDAVFQVTADSPYARLIELYGRSLLCNDPAYVELYNSGRLLEAKDNAGGLNISAEQVNAWEQLTPGGLDNPPLHQWKNADGSELLMNGVFGTGMSDEFTELTGDIDIGDAFSLSKTRVLAFGRMALTLTVPVAGSRHITGVTHPEAEVRITVGSEQGAQKYTSSIIADTDGVFMMLIDTPLVAADTVSAVSGWRYLTANAAADVSETGELSLLVPETMGFFSEPLSDNLRLIERIDPEWRLVVSDTRGTGGGWQLTARLSQPLTPEDASLPALEGAVVFVDSEGTQTPLTGEDGLLIRSHTTISDSDVTGVGWTSGAGILIRNPGSAGYSGVKYTAIIHWTLSDAP